MIAEFSYAQPFEKRPRAVVVVTPPSQCDGRDAIKSEPWRIFAAKHNVALAGCFFRDGNIGRGGIVEDYCNVGPGGLGEHLPDVLLDFLDGKGKMGDRLPPLLLWGFSAGGQFNYEFACWQRYANRVAGFVVNKGGVYYTALAPEHVHKIPSLWIYGEHDSPWRQDIVRGIYGLNRAAGAKDWQMVCDYGVGHAVGSSLALGQAFFERVLKGLP